MTGSIASSATAVATAPVLEVHGVTKAFSSGPPWHRRRVEVLRGASLEVRPGELVGLVGENGSGKSTLMQVIVGLLARDGGSVVASRPAGLLPAAAAAVGQADRRRALRAVRAGLRLDDAARRRLARRAARRAAASASTSATGSRSSRAAPARSSTSRWRCCTSRSCCCSTSPTPALTGRPTCASGRWPSAAGPTGMGILIVSHLLAERERLTRIYELRDGRCEVVS